MTQEAFLEPGPWPRDSSGGGHLKLSPCPVTLAQPPWGQCPSKPVRGHCAQLSWTLQRQQAEDTASLSPVPRPPGGRPS